MKISLSNHISWGYFELNYVNLKPFNLRKKPLGWKFIRPDLFVFPLFVFHFNPTGKIIYFSFYL